VKPIFPDPPIVAIEHDEVHPHYDIVLTMDGIKETWDQTDDQERARLIAKGFALGMQAVTGRLPVCAFELNDA
jgi:hypothetical protein